MIKKFLIILIWFVSIFYASIFTYENLPIDYESKHAFISKLRNSNNDKIIISLNDNQDISSDIIQKYK